MAYYRPRSKMIVSKTYPTVDVVAAAIIAYATNSSSVIKADASEYKMLNYETNEEVVVPAVVANKTRMRTLLEASAITDADRATADEAMTRIRNNITMSVLSGKKISDFVVTLAKELDKQEIPEVSFGLLAYVANVEATIRKKDDVDEKTNERMYSSIALGAVGDKVTVKFTLITSNYIERIGCHSVYGHDENENLVSFLTAKAELAASGTYTGKIKKVGPDAWRNNATVTQLNYVKPV